MLGLFERLGEGLEMIAMPIGGLISSANCTVQNLATDIGTEVKCRQIDREFKNKSANESSEKKVSIDDIIKTFSEGDETKIEDLKKLATTSIEDMRESLAKATPEQLAELNKSIEALDLMGNFIFTMRAEAAKALQQATPIFQQPVVTLHEQAAKRGGVSGRDIVERLQNPQQANPEDINNPIPTQA